MKTFILIIVMMSMSVLTLYMMVSGLERVKAGWTLHCISIFSWAILCIGSGLYLFQKKTD